MREQPGSAELRQQIERDVQQALRDAQQAARDAQQAQRDARQAQADAQDAQGEAAQPAVAPGEVFRVGPEGVIIRRPGGEQVIVQPDPSKLPPWMINQGPPPGAVAMAIAFFAMIAFIIVGLPIARAVARRMDRSGAAAPKLAAEQAEQLRQIQTSLDAMAVEVERISENQRFVTRLLAEGRPAEGALGSRPLAAVPTAEAREPGARSG